MLYNTETPRGLPVNVGKYSLTLDYNCPVRIVLTMWKVYIYMYMYTM